MCGRYTLAANHSELQETFPGFAFPDAFPPRYNIAPSLDVAVVPNDGLNRVQLFKWGLIPGWSKDPKIGNRLINARSETLAEKPSFREAYQQRRCLVLADGFYEWRQDLGAKAKTPMYIRLTPQKPFAFAGLWETWTSPDKTEVRTCTIITTHPNVLMADIHNRMPVILPPDKYESWLLPGEAKPQDLSELLKPYPDGFMQAHPVSRLVNNPKEDRPECIQQAVPEPPPQTSLF
ncbi:MAG: SOS response-associated peptidase [bacterium]|nr:SOS response-associated peptidase [bacterium]